MKKFVLEIIDFTSIFKGYRIRIPFFLLCIGINNINILQKIANMGLSILCNMPIYIMKGLIENTQEKEVKNVLYILYE